MEKNDSRAVFVVLGDPVGKARPRVCNVAGKARAFTPKKTKDYEELVRAEYARQVGATISGALMVCLTFEVEPPKSWSQKKKADAISGAIYHTSKPDIDNLIKLVLDALNNCAYLDDSAIVKVSAIKRYAEKSQMICEIRSAF